MAKPVISEAEAERRVDARLMKALHTDPRYIHAENAEAQAQAEDDISQEIWDDIECKYEISC